MICSTKFYRVAAIPNKALVDDNGELNQSRDAMWYQLINELYKNIPMLNLGQPKKGFQAYRTQKHLIAGS